MQTRPDPVLPADEDARALAQSLLRQARHAALGVLDPEHGGPAVSLIAFGLDPEGIPLTLISGLAPHMAALRANPAASVMVGDPGPKGDPLTHPRLMIRAEARLIDRASDDHALLRDHWLVAHPKAKLYIDFTDFAFARLHPASALLNAGFGRAFRLSPTELLPGGASA
ncbi:pyridoxamine 5-phosphate oxidase [Cereibacter changlensis]|uniref:Pyridoxamine 5-phosphate oxidase n=1 Tax=Cereibacter changlensis TaxID=402884 RepID=A0A4U0YWI3_9RHOB|nr:pyridoxamine 5'-phosphate oxidase family protein [Cereibacter changlensis]TKA94394.1 pyridoxamine 5-phosphate oxidase [Cereibacter changlensis]